MPEEQSASGANLGAAPPGSIIEMVESQNTAPGGDFSQAEKPSDDSGDHASRPRSETSAPGPRSSAEYTEFTLPEGMVPDESGLADFKSFAQEQDLTQEQAQKILEFGGQRLKERLEAPYKAWSEMQAKWQTEVKADPEIGGTKLEQSIKEASLVFLPGESNPFVKTAAEAQALRTALNTTGVGNNPAMVKLFVKIGRMLAEPGPLTGRPTPMDSQGDLLARMYPTMNE